MNTDEEFIIIRENLPKKISLLSIFNKGVMIGFLMCLSIFGILQQAQRYLDPDNALHIMVAKVVEKYWFHTGWYFWFGLLFLAIISLFLIRSRLSK